jgi:hypothetical protein
MAIRFYRTQIIGDGKSRQTAYRLDLPYVNGDQHPFLLPPHIALIRPRLLMTGGMEYAWGLAKIVLPTNKDHEDFAAANPKLELLPDRLEVVGGKLGAVIVRELAQTLNPNFDDSKVKPITPEELAAINARIVAARIAKANN